MSESAECVRGVDAHWRGFGARAGAGRGLPRHHGAALVAPEQKR